MEERKRISDLWRNGYSRGQIAQALARDKSTISREIKRNRHGCLYCPVLATQKALERRRQRKLVRKMDRPEIADPVRSRLKELHSPDEIAGWMKLSISDPRQRLSATTIYCWIHAQPRGTWDRCLRRYSPWQRGTNENTNGLLRQFFPKGQSLENISPRRVAHVAQLLNNRPRKSLGYLTPSEVFTTQKYGCN
jgi:IS30 family transposase